MSKRRLETKSVPTNKKSRVEMLPTDESFTKIYPDGSWFVYIHDFLEQTSIAEKDLLTLYLKDIEWKDEKRFYGNPPARKTKWFGDFAYTYSGKKNPIDTNYPKYLKELQQLVQDATNAKMKELDSKKTCVYSGVLLNLYSNGRDSITWHSDDERDLEPDVPIASFTLGCEREFRLKSKDHLLKIKLKSGSLFLMGGTAQTHWKHCVLKDSSEDPRINMTFRMYSQ